MEAVLNHFDYKAVSSANKSVCEKERSEFMPFVSLPKRSSSAEPFMPPLRVALGADGICFSGVWWVRFLSSYRISSLLGSLRHSLGLAVHTEPQVPVCFTHFSVCLHPTQCQAQISQEAFVGWTDEWKLAFMGFD